MLRQLSIKNFAFAAGTISLLLGAVLLSWSCGKNLNPASSGPLTVVAVLPTGTSTPTPTVTATPGPSLMISWIGLPAAETFSYGVIALTTLQVILEAGGQEPVSVSQIVLGGPNPPSFDPPFLIPDNLTDDPAADGVYLYSGSPVGYPATVNGSFTDIASNLVFTGISNLILAPDQPQTFLLVFDFSGTPVTPSGIVFSTLSAQPIKAYGVSTGEPASVYGGPIIGNNQTITYPTPLPTAAQAYLTPTP